VLNVPAFFNEIVNAYLPTDGEKMNKHRINTLATDFYKR